MDLNPDDARQYLEDIDYPASKEDLASGAENNGAPDELIQRIQTLSTPQYSGVDEVIEELRSSPTSG